MISLVVFEQLFKLKLNNCSILVFVMVNKVKFNRDEVITKAQMLFWKKGFSTTSTRDLQTVVEMRPGSIYSAFGSKEGLYSESLKVYATQLQLLLASHIENSETVLDGLHAFVVTVLESAEDGCEVCMLIKASTEFDHTQPKLKTLTDDLLQQFEHDLSTLFDIAQQRGELANTHSPLEYARLFQIQFTGLRSYLHRPMSKPMTEQLIGMMFTLIKNY